jgi:hypothetical protein
MEPFWSWKSFLKGAFLSAALCLLTWTAVMAKDQKDTIAVERDKDKTSYVIRGSNDSAEKEDKDRAWEMLDRVIIDTRGRHGEGPDNHR